MVEKLTLWFVVLWTGAVATNNNNKTASEYLKASIIKCTYSGEVE